MMYEIQNQSDFQTGASLIVRIPEDELDKKALYTILAEQPDFLLPFRHIFVDGQIEFTFLIGNRSKLTYLSGNKSPTEYADLWFNLLHPILNCDDWFMNPYSFVLSPEYLYCDAKAICFVYIPSVRPCSDFNTLKSMVTEIARQNHVTDLALENKVMWAMQDFNLGEFLQMLRPYRGYAQGAGEQNAAQQYAPAQQGAAQQYAAAQQGAAQQYAPPIAAPRNTPTPPPKPEKISKQQAAAAHVTPPPPPPPPMPGIPGDISIDLPPDGKERKREKAQKAPFQSKEKEPKAQKEPKEKGGFLGGRKKGAQQEIIAGAAAAPMQQGSVQQTPFRQEQMQQGPMQQPMQQGPMYAPPAQGGYDDGATQIDLREAAGPKFRYIGNGSHPAIITVPIGAGGVFTIGRFDPSAGPGQSSFEFSKDTKAVSRRHAAIERRPEGFIISDMNSSAGTFLNGQKMPPNTPCRLEKGCRISFGYSGADYLWEE